MAPLSANRDDDDLPTQASEQLIRHGGTTKAQWQPRAPTRGSQRHGTAKSRTNREMRKGAGLPAPFPLQPLRKRRLFVVLNPEVYLPEVTGQIHLLELDVVLGAVEGTVILVTLLETHGGIPFGTTQGSRIGMQ